MKKISIFLFKPNQNLSQLIHTIQLQRVSYNQVAKLLTHPKDKEFYLNTLSLCSVSIVKQLDDDQIRINYNH